MSVNENVTLHVQVRLSSDALDMGLNGFETDWLGRSFLLPCFPRDAPPVVPDMTTGHQGMDLYRSLRQGTEMGAEMSTFLRGQTDTSWRYLA